MSSSFLVFHAPDIPEEFRKSFPEEHYISVCASEIFFLLKQLRRRYTKKVGKLFKAFKNLSAAQKKPPGVTSEAGGQNARKHLVEKHLGRACCICKSTGG